MSDSAPVNAVISSSSVTKLFDKIADTAFFAAFIIVSCTPPKCGASGGLKYHLIPFL